MTARIRSLVVIASLAAAILSVSGCKKKRPPVPPPQAQAPTIETPAPEQPATPPAAPATTETTTTTTPPPAPAPKPKRRIAKKPSAGVPPASSSTATPTVATNGTNPTPPAPAPPPKVVVRDGSAPEPTSQISTTMPVNKENETKLNTERSLQNTEKNLTGITWTPSGDQRVMIDQIKTYINQSREANTQGDVIRASNLAQKAHLLCDELLKK